MRHAPESLMQDVTPRFELDRLQPNYWAVIEFHGRTDIDKTVNPASCANNRQGL